MPGEAEKSMNEHFQKFREWLTMLHEDSERRTGSLEKEQAAFREASSYNREIAQHTKERVVALETKVDQLQRRLEGNGFVLKRVCQAYHETTNEKVRNLDKRFWAVLMTAISGLGGTVFLLVKTVLEHT